MLSQFDGLIDDAHAFSDWGPPALKRATPPYIQNDLCAHFPKRKSFRLPATSDRSNDVETELQKAIIGLLPVWSDIQQNHAHPERDAA